MGSVAGADGWLTPADFEAWLRPHWPVMKRLADRLVGWPDAEDVLAEAVLQAWRKRQRFDPVRGTARSWLLALVVEQTRRRARRRRSLPVSALGEDLAAIERSPADPDVDAAVRALSVRQRLAVELFYFADLPVAEVAAVMGCSEGTAKATLHTARTRLRDRLGETSHAPE